MTIRFAIVVGVVGAATISACTARAEPSKFPDLSKYTSVNISDYTIDTSTPGMPSHQVFFISPDGIECDVNVSSAGCSGNNFPRVPPQRWNPAAGITGVNTISTDSGLSATNAAFPPDNRIHGQPVKTLPPFHSITVSGIICGVDDKRTTACKDLQGHGFVLSPSWSGWLPKV
jgi:hypothetical protein